MAVHEVRIGVVDDEPFFRDAIVEILGDAGYECITAIDTQAALELATNESVGVIVLDVRLSGGGGLEVLRKLRESRPALRVIVLSASTDQETVLQALRLGACDYLAKPLHDEELVLAAGRAVGTYALEAGARRLREQIKRLAALASDLGSLPGRQDLAGDEREAYLRQAAVHGAAELLSAEKTSLMLLSEEAEELRVVAAVTPGIASAEMDPVAVGQGVAGVAFERGEGVLRESGQPRSKLASVPDRYRSDSFVVTPIGTADRNIGVLCATEPVRDAGFRAEDLELLQIFAGHLAGLLEASREAKEPSVPREERHEEEEEIELADVVTTPPPDAGRDDTRREETAREETSREETSREQIGREETERDAELVRQICEALVNEVEPERIVRAVLQPIERELGAAPVSLHLLDGSTGELRCEGQLDGGMRADRMELPTASGLTGTVLQTGRLVATGAPQTDPRYDAEVDTPEDGKPGPMLCVPLSLRGQVVGLCRVFLPEGAPASAGTGEALASVLSAAVRNVLLYRSLVESIEEVAEARRQARP